MQGAWGWGDFKPHSSKTCDDVPWQGQWENDRCGEVSGWETSTWDQLSKGASSHDDEFENVLRWDDSGAQEAFETAQKIQEGNAKGLTPTLLLPSPDLYIQVIDWDSREDLKLPDSAENFSQFGEGTGHRKRGRRGGTFRRQFDRQESTRAADWKQNGKSFVDPVSAIEANPEADHLRNHGSLNTPAPDLPLDAHQKESLPCELRSPVQDHARSNWSPQWSSQPHHRQNFATSNWQDPGRSNWNEGYNHQSRHEWQQANVSYEPVRGWGRGGFPHHGSHGWPNDAHHHQSIPAARMSNSGNEWMHQGDVNGRGFRRQPIDHFNRGSIEQRHVPRPVPGNNNRWRQQQKPLHPWQQ